MRTNKVCGRLLLLCLAWLLAACGTGYIEVTRHLDEEADIFPDYKEVTIPPNIAPLNFCVNDSTPHLLTIRGGGDQAASIQVKSRDGLFVIPAKKWKALLAAHAGGQIELAVARRIGGEWAALVPFHIHVAQEPIDPYLAYRLIPPYEQWYRMGLFQRHLESYEQTAIYENKLGDYNCVNCHTFVNGDPQHLMFHMRGKGGGTALLNRGELVKVDTKTDKTISNLVYPYWHPSGRYMVASVNTTLQNYYFNNHDHVETYDTESDVVVYDVERDELFSSSALKSDSAFETFPTFSPDGRSLYFTTAARVDSVALHPDRMMYSLCRVDFDPDSRTIGQTVDTIFNAPRQGKSVSHPRISPDGKLMVVCLQGYGNFSVNNSDADLYAIDMDSGQMYPLEAVNSGRSDSWHSWGCNSRWMVFSSRRTDGYYTRPHFTYIDAQGQAHKPFLLPQKDPKQFYKDLMYSFNLPELVRGKVTLNQRQIIETMLKPAERKLTYKE